MNWTKIAILGGCAYMLLRKSESDEKKEIEQNYLKKYQQIMSQMQALQEQFYKQAEQVDTLTNAKQLTADYARKIINLSWFHFDISCLDNAAKSNCFDLKLVIDTANFGANEQIEFVGFAVLDPLISSGAGVSPSFSLNQWSISNVYKGNLPADITAKYFTDIPANKELGRDYVTFKMIANNHYENIVAGYDWSAGDAMLKCADDTQLNNLKRVIIDKYREAKGNSTNRLLTSSNMTTAWSAFRGLSFSQKYNNPIDLVGSFVLFFRTQGVVVDVPYYNVNGTLWYKPIDYNFTNDAGVNLKRIFK